MTPAALRSLILELSAAIDTGKYDSVSVAEMKRHFEAKDVIPWLRANVPDMDLSLWTEDRVTELHDLLHDFHNAYAGNERRKWGIENRGLLLLLVWTLELLK